MFAVSIPNSRTSASFVDTATKCLATAGLPAASPSPASSQSRAVRRVGQRLERRERLRADDEQRLLGLEVAHRFPEVGAVDVAHEAERQVALGEVAQRLVGHRGPEVGAADPDVDDVADPLARVPGPRAAADPVGEVGHLLQDGVDLGDDVGAVDLDVLAFRRPQRHVEDGPVLGDVDLLAREHRVDAGPQPGPLGEREEQPHGLVGDAVLRVVEVDAVDLEREALAAGRCPRRTGRGGAGLRSPGSGSVAPAIPVSR